VTAVSLWAADSARSLLCSPRQPALRSVPAPAFSATPAHRSAPPDFWPSSAPSSAPNHNALHLVTGCLLIYCRSFWVSDVRQVMFTCKVICLLNGNVRAEFCSIPLKCIICCYYWRHLPFSLQQVCVAWDLFIVAFY